MFTMIRSHFLTFHVLASVTYSHPSWMYDHMIKGFWRLVLEHCSEIQSEQPFLVSLGYRKSGAVGSRLTGAGWGGCAVSMVPGEKVEAFLQAVREAYYLPDPRRAAMEKQSLFVSKPGGGAAIFLEEWNASSVSVYTAITHFQTLCWGEINKKNVTLETDGTCKWQGNTKCKSYFGVTSFYLFTLYRLFWNNNMGQKLTAVVSYFLQREYALCVQIMNVRVFVINWFCIAHSLSHCSHQKRKDDK